MSIIVGLVQDNDAGDDTPFVIIPMPSKPIYAETINLTVGEWAGRWTVKHVEHQVPARDNVALLVWVQEITIHEDLVKEEPVQVVMLTKETEDEVN